VCVCARARVHSNSPPPPPGPLARTCLHAFAQESRSRIPKRCERCPQGPGEASEGRPSAAPPPGVPPSSDPKLHESVLHLMAATSDALKRSAERSIKPRPSSQAAESFRDVDRDAPRPLNVVESRDPPAEAGEAPVATAPANHEQVAGARGQPEGSAEVLMDTPAGVVLRERALGEQGPGSVAGASVPGGLVLSGDAAGGPAADATVQRPSAFVPRDASGEEPGGSERSTPSGILFHQHPEAGQLGDLSGPYRTMGDGTRP
jgi:hypothetical protein